MSAAERPKGRWPEWMEDVLHYAPIWELEDGWRSDIGDAITRVLDRRAESLRAAAVLRPPTPEGGERAGE